MKIWQSYKEIQEKNTVGNNANAHISYMRITWEEWLSEQAKGMGNIARSLSPSLL